MTRIITLTPNPVRDYAVEADFVKPNRKIRCRNPQTHPGGGGVNVARATSRLGAKTLAIMTAGGAAGEAMKIALSAENVPMRAVPVAGETRIAFHVRDIAGENEYRFNLPGAEMSNAEVDHLLRALGEETGPGDYVVGSGSLPPGAPKDFWAQAARIVKRQDGRFVLDSISGIDAALREGVHMVRQNEYEYPALAGRTLKWRSEIEAFAIEQVNKGGVEAMVVSHGGDGSLMATKDGVAFAPSFKIKATSAVGAGDSFVGGLLTGLVRGWTNEQALRYGMAAAGATRMSEGTALFKREDVERLYQSAA